MERKYLEYFDGAFDSTVADKMKPENKPYVAYSKTQGMVYTIVPKEDGTMYTIYRVVSKDISNCTYNMVDLGLPSGLKWADRNVGATSPEDFGSYFQWGDTNAYTYDGAGKISASELASLLQLLVGDEMEVNEDNIEDVLLMMFDGYDVGTDLTNTPAGPLGFSLDKLFNWNSYFDTIDAGSTFNKYNNKGLTVLESIDDAVTVHMGSNYRMPTIKEINELINNTTLTFIGIDGNEYIKGTDDLNILPGKLKGIRFTGSNGNSIFVPDTGSCYDSVLNGPGIFSDLWSSSLSVSNDGYADVLHFYYDGSVNETMSERYFGNSVRGVQP